MPVPVVDPVLRLERFAPWFAHRELTLDDIVPAPDGCRGDVGARGDHAHQRALQRRNQQQCIVEVDRWE